MKSIVMPVLVLSLTACDPDVSGVAARGDILNNRVCTEQQKQRVEKETLFCVKNTGFLGSDCYVNSMRRVCSRGPAQ